MTTEAANLGGSAAPATSTEVTTPTDTTSIASQTSDSSAAAEFNGNEYEQSFGLPAGSLKDAKDAESALAIIRSHTDKTLLAGDSFVPTGTVPVAETTAAKIEAAAKVETPAAGSNPELDALRAKVDALTAANEQQTKAQQQSTLAEVMRRFNVEVDSWASAKYGVNGTRTYAQQQEYKSLQHLLATHVAGHQATGSPMPVVEQALRQVRVFHDADYKPTQNTKAVPVGSPGSGSKTGATGADGPRNIHAALMGNNG